MSETLETLGTIISENEKRDAIHLAVEPVIAAHNLTPGSHVGFIGNEVGICDSPVGIVDPFLKGVVQKGQRFWLVIYPRKITSLRHVWTHPDFPDVELPPVKNPSDIAASEKWLRDFAENHDCPRYDVLIAAATGMSVADEDGCGGSRINEDYLHFTGFDAHGAIPPEFWDHVECATGKKCFLRPTYFSCSC